MFPCQAVHTSNSSARPLSRLPWCRPSLISRLSYSSLASYLCFSVNLSVRSSGLLPACLRLWLSLVPLVRCLPSLAPLPLFWLFCASSFTTIFFLYLFRTFLFALFLTPFLPMFVIDHYCCLAGTTRASQHSRGVAAGGKPYLSSTACDRPRLPPMLLPPMKWQPPDRLDQSPTAFED